MLQQPVHIQLRDQWVESSRRLHRRLCQVSGAKNHSCSPNDKFLGVEPSQKRPKRRPAHSRRPDMVTLTHAGQTPWLGLLSLYWHCPIVAYVYHNGYTRLFVAVFVLWGLPNRPPYTLHSSWASALLCCLWPREVLRFNTTVKIKAHWCFTIHVYTYCS